MQCFASCLRPFCFTVKKLQILVLGKHTRNDILRVDIRGFELAVHGAVPLLRTHVVRVSACVHNQASAVVDDGRPMLRVIQPENKRSDSRAREPRVVQALVEGRYNGLGRVERRLSQMGQAQHKRQQACDAGACELGKRLGEQLRSLRQVARVPYR